MVNHNNNTNTTHTDNSTTNEKSNNDNKHDRQQQQRPLRMSTIMNSLQIENGWESDETESTNEEKQIANNDTHDIV